MPTPKDQRDYRAEYDKFQGTPEQRRNNDKRKKARRAMEKAGKVKKGDGKEVDHVRPLRNGGGNTEKNWKVMSRHMNRTKA